MPYTIVDPRDPTQDTNLPAPNIFRGTPPLPPVLPPGLRSAVSAPQVAATPQLQPGAGGFWDMLRSLFTGSSGQPQGMTGLLARGRGGPGTDQLGNPVGRY